MDQERGIQRLDQYTTLSMNRDMNQIPQSVKVRSTCNACQRAKIRCSHERPSCRRCEKHGMDCVYSVSRRLGRPAKKKASRMESIPSDHGSSCESAIPSSNEMKPPKIPTEKTSHQMKQLRTRGKDRQRCKPEEHLGGKTRTLSAIESQSDILGRCDRSFFIGPQADYLMTR